MANHLLFSAQSLASGMLAQAPLPQPGQGLVLVSWWKALLLIVPFALWAWYVSKVLDKHAARFLLPREKFNTVHLTVGLAAVILALVFPMRSELAFWLGFGVMTLLLLADLLVFIAVHNKDERVPEKFRLSLLNPKQLQEKKEAKSTKATGGKAEYGIKSPDKTLVPVPDAEAPEYQVRLAAEKLYGQLLASRATQVELLPTGKDNSYRASFLVDGIPTQGDTFPGPDAVKLMDFWKAAAKLDVNERRKKQQAEVTMEQGDSRRKLRVTSIGTQAGMRLLLLLDSEKSVVRKTEELGLLDSQKADLEKLVKEVKGGVVLLASPPDAGRTTTFYTIMRMHDAYTSNVQTIEMDPQAALEGVRLNKYEAVADGPEYGTTVRSILRRDPDVLGVAELPDANTAKEVCRGDMDRCRVYVCVKADNAMQALQGWVKLVGDPELATKPLQAIVAQKLVRKLCGNCKTAYQPSPDMLKKLGLPPEGVKQLFKKGGQVMVKDKVQTCPACQGSGYLGQEGIFEVYLLEAAHRALIKAGDLGALKLELRKAKLPSMQQAALRKALDGLTSVEEVIRVTTDQEAAAPTPQAPAGAPKPPAPAAPAPAKK